MQGKGETMEKTREMPLEALVNCCNHGIDIELPSGSVVTIQPSNKYVIRLVVSESVERVAGGIPITRTTYFHSALLPPVKEGVLYIVPTQVALAYAGVRDDFVSPDTRTATEWDDKNVPKSVKQLRFPPKLRR